MLFSFRSSSAHFLLVPLVLLGGCSQEKLNEIADKAKQAVSEQASKVGTAVSEKVGSAADTAKEQLSLAGSMTFQLTEPLSTAACYVQFITVGNGRSNVLQLTTYRDAKQESFPSALVHSQVQAAGLSELVGQSVSATVFIQPAANGPVWFCPAGTQLQLKIVSFDGTQLEVELTGSLRHSESGADQPITGKLTGVVSSSS